MTRRRQRSGGRLLLCWALMSPLLLASCGTREVPDPPSEVGGLREVQRVPVKSSNLQSVGYDVASRTLTIEFRSGSIYEFEEVPPEVHTELMNAESHGKYFHRRIRDAGYTAHRLK